MRKYSRLEKTQTLKERKNARLYILLTIVLIALLAKFGISALSGFASFLSDIKNTESKVDASDTTPPIVPRFSNLPAEVNMPKIELSGTGEPSSTITIVVNGDSTELLAASNGTFTTEITLSDGENSIIAFATDTNGNESGKTDTITIIYDHEAPELTVTKPEDGASFYGAKQRQIVIEGSVKEDVEITINDRIVIINGANNFAFTTTLVDGENKFLVKAIDRAGNTTEKELTLHYAS